VIHNVLVAKSLAPWLLGVGFAVLAGGLSISGVFSRSTLPWVILAGLALLFLLLWRGLHMTIGETLLGVAFAVALSLVFGSIVMAVGYLAFGSGP
jgi:hypothetical protein